MNYQKIELARVVNDLEQANREIESQTEIMRYMASSFDINKNINVIVDAIMDVKNPKLCAVYMDGAVNSDNRGICIIKTDYASMERRLRKDFEKIYSDFAESRKTTELLVGDELKELRFIGETNIKSLVKLAMINDNKQYGMMLIASNEENFSRRESRTMKPAWWNIMYLSRVQSFIYRHRIWRARMV